MIKTIVIADLSFFFRGRTFRGDLVEVKNEKKNTEIIHAHSFPFKGNISKAFPTGAARILLYRNYIFNKSRIFGPWLNAHRSTKVPSKYPLGTAAPNMYSTSRCSYIYKFYFHSCCNFTLDILPICSTVAFLIYCLFYAYQF